MEIRICECQKPLCRYRWIPRIGNKYGVSVEITEPKECPSCKHQFHSRSWSIKAKCWNQTVNNMNELKALKESVKKWNQEERYTAPFK